MTAIDEVRDFYERMPYPPPLARLREDDDPRSSARRRRALFHRTWPRACPRSGLAILVAGCGTSQGARYALREPDAHVVAIDVSEASVRHTRALQRAHRLDNLEVHRLAIDEVARLGETFDLVVCTGVLHHLRDPELGLRALRGVLRPAGAMQLMVYARYGRAGIYMMQEYCRLLDVGTSEAELRALRSTLAALPPSHAMSEVLRHARDFQRPEAMADALLHPRDRAYTVPELYALLAGCGMRFGRWTEQAPYLPQCGLVARSPHAARLATLPEPLQHAAVELFRGTMVTHGLVAHRDDDPTPPQPIGFAGDGWRALVPIALPWTVRVRDRERLPAGSVAVLINPAHTCTDLVLPVAADEDALLAAIDGERTLGAIVDAAGRRDGAEGAARDFFERLWRYDQIVFDASAAAS